MKKRYQGTMKLFVMTVLMTFSCILATTGTASAIVTNNSTHYFYETKDQLQIVKTAQDFSGFEVLYQTNPREHVFNPEYYDNRVFFWSTEATKGNSTYKLKSIDVNTKEVKTVAVDAASPKVLKGKVYMWKFTAPGQFELDLWMCNLDGTGLKKTSATGVDRISTELFEVDGKIVFVRTEGGVGHNDGTGVFCKINLDGSGYSSMFRIDLRYVTTFEILFTHQGYIYYNATGFLQREASQAGIYRTKANGSGTKMMFDQSIEKSAYLVAPYGDKLYFFHYRDGLCSVDLQGNNRKILNFKPENTYDLKVLNTGYINFNGFLPNGVKKGTEVLHSIDPNYPNTVDLGKFMPKSPYDGLTVGMTLLAPPNKLNYVVGEVFDRTGFSALYYTGKSIFRYNDEKIKVSLKDGTVITEGYQFKKPGIYEIVVNCSANNNVNLDVVVTEVGENKRLDNISTGWYKLRSLKTNVGVNADGGVVMSSAVPQEAFLITNLGNMRYTIQTADNRYVSSKGAFKNLMPLLMGADEYLWTLTEQRDETYSLRPYIKQTMTVNVTGSRTTNGTALMLWNSGVKNLTENSKFALVPTSAPLKPETAVPSVTKLTVNGKPTAVDAYIINQNNYIKLRDLATMLNGTIKNFNVEWDGAKNAINLKSYTAYAPVGGEMTMGDGQSKNAVPSTSAIYVNNVSTDLAVYRIGENNYFKLRDVMKIFSVQVGWDPATGTATLDTSYEYIT